MEIYTIGHSNYTMERLIDMLEYYNINCVVDIRGTPYSKYNIQFDKEAIRYTLTNAGFVYIYMGKELAAKRIRKNSYNNEGYSNFEEVIKEKVKSINSILKYNGEWKNEGTYGCEKGYKIILLGAMQDPIRCHRSILVGRELVKNDFDVKHILDDYSIVTQDDIEEMLLNKYFSNRNQITIEDLTGLNNEEMINEGYKLANREIGYRIENLK